MFRNCNLFLLQDLWSIEFYSDAIDFVNVDASSKHPSDIFVELACCYGSQLEVITLVSDGNDRLSDSLVQKSCHHLREFCIEGFIFFPVQ
jgi:hypothetical protein